MNCVLGDDYMDLSAPIWIARTRRLIYYVAAKQRAQLLLSREHRTETAFLSHTHTRRGVLLAASDALYGAVWFDNMDRIYMLNDADGVPILWVVYPPDMIAIYFETTS